MAIDIATLKADLTAGGIDVIHEADVRWYNAHVAELPLNPLPTFDRPNGDALCLLLGNSVALWPAFLTWLGSQPHPEAVTDPLDRYSTALVSAAIAKLTRSGEVRHETFWVYHGGDRLVSMQRMALTAGLCYHDSETQLAIHPTFGAWVAFRAVVVLDAPSGLDATPPPRRECLLGEDEKAAAREAMAAALRASDQANLCTQLHGEKGMETDVRMAWAALRDCVRLGREHRYSDEQLIYHYTKDVAVLMSALKVHQGAAVAARA